MIDADDCRRDGELVAWINAIPISKPTKNWTKDFSDAVLVAEILKVYYPRYVELHNYVPASNVNTKIENWSTLNRKVLARIDMKLNRETIHQLAHASQGAVERFLTELRTRILKDEDAQKPRTALKNIAEDTEAQRDTVGNGSAPSSQCDLTGGNLKEPSANEIRSCKSSTFSYFKRGLFGIVDWIVCLLRIRSVLSYCTLPHFGGRKRDAAANERLEQENDEIVPRKLYAELKEELQEKEEVICSLNHKVAYLESSMKLRDLRISNLTAQILRNTAEMDNTAKTHSHDVKLRSRSHNLHEDRLS